MHKVFHYLFFAFLIISCQTKESLTLTFTGDVILDRGVSDELRLYGDSLLLNAIDPLLTSDYNIINLETVLTQQDICSDRKFNFRYNPDIAKYLKRSGITHVSIANNHSLDFSLEGFEENFNVLESHNLIVLGYDCKVSLIEKGDVKLGIIAANLTENNYHLCIQNENQLINQVILFNEEHPGFRLIVYLHWGLEYQLQPEIWQTNLAMTLIDYGASAIIGHHPHVFQSIEYYKNKPILYSLGNFVADAYLPNTTKGIIANVSINSDSLSLSIEPVDIGNYFPKQMKLTDQVSYFLHSLKYNPKTCYYYSQGNWHSKNIKEIDFSEKAELWLFHVKNDDQIAMAKLRNGTHKMTLFNNGKAQKSMSIIGDLSEIEIADVAYDHDPEILLGVTKFVNFDKSYKKRLNIFSIENGGFKSIWLGTKFLYDLHSFDISEQGVNTYLITNEIDSNNTFYQASYIWDEFGFALNTVNKLDEKN